MNALAKAAVAVCAAGATCSAQAAAVKVDVMANIAHWTGAQKIGTITMDSNFEKKANGVEARFEFASAWADLDKTYDFDWVNLARGMSDGYKVLFPRGAPAIDPQSGDVSGAAEDDYPYYYNYDKEWTPNKFGTDPDGKDRPIHEEGKYSRFIDFPKSPDKGDFLDFSVLLSVRDDGKITKDGKETFCVLAGIDWKYTADGVGVGASEALKERTINDAFMKDLLLKALGEDHKDAFDKWTASFGCTLVPAPGPVALAALGLLLGVRRSR